MTKHYCDVCRKELVHGEDERYTVRIETFRHGDPIELTDEDFNDQDHLDHIDAIDDLLSEQQQIEEDEIEVFSASLPEKPTVGSHAFDLCGRCYIKYQSNPLGMERPQTGRYSPN